MNEEPITRRRQGEPAIDWGDRPEIADVEANVRLGGAYRVLRALGRGGMGLVLLARDEALERDVAVKLVRCRGQSRERFLAEARAMARVRHPNVVEVYAVGEHEGQPFFVMEYVAGPSLDVWIRAHGPPADPEAAIAMVERIAGGVEAIHAAGAVHRDLKPANVLVGAGGRPVVTDFGLALALEAHAEIDLSGTPGYMAPEVVSGAVRDELATRIDVWALAAIAFELLTGRVLVPRDSVVSGTLGAGRARATQLRPELPRAIDEVLARALARDPRERTPTAAAFAGELRRAWRPHGAFGGARVVVLDEDERERRALAEVLRAELPGCEVVEADDGSRPGGPGETAAAAAGPPELCPTRDQNPT